MGYLIEEVGALSKEDVTDNLKKVLLHLAQVIEDTESEVKSVSEESGVRVNAIAIDSEFKSLSSP